MPYIVTTPPTELPVSIGDLKEQCSIDHSALDVRLGAWLEAAMVKVERHLERALITQTRKEYFRGFCDDEIWLTGPPLQSVVSVKYYDVLDAVATVPATLYDVDTVHEPGCIRLKYGKYWPVTVLRPTNPVVVEYVCGYGGADDVPAPIKQAVLLLAASYVRNREAETSAVNDFKVLKAYEDILRDYRKIW